MSNKNTSAKIATVVSLLEELEADVSLPYKTDIRRAKNLLSATLRREQQQWERREYDGFPVSRRTTFSYGRKIIQTLAENFGPQEFTNGQGIPVVRSRFPEMNADSYHIQSAISSAYRCGAIERKAAHGITRFSYRFVPQALRDLGLNPA